MAECDSQQVTTISVLGDGTKDAKILFGEKDVRYAIPVYQRAFAWGVDKPGEVTYENEIERLMDDVHGLESGKENYYIGSLVVCRKQDPENKDKVVFEVIDGQQRLTALYIVLKCLAKPDREIAFNSSLSYDCREKSQLAVQKIDEIVNAVKEREWSENAVHEDPPPNDDERKDEKRQWKFGKDDLENSICEAVRTVFRRFEKEDGYCKTLFENLKKVRLFRIEVPEGTDLNRYFEIMNTRGRQLEQSDIVKARLMGWLDSDKKKEWFARIWNACRDMSGYVQMHFPSNVRRIVFGNAWDSLPTEETVKAAMGEPATSRDLQGSGQTQQSSILDALLNPKKGSNVDDENDRDEDDDSERFGSIIEFPQFLLHVLKVFRGQSGSPAPTDAQILAKEFEGTLEKSSNDNENANCAWNFILCLLKCRFLFDKFFIKRDYGEDSPDGEWSLKKVVNRSDNPYQEEDKCCLMIQSCLRVTYTETKRMHWITRILGNLDETNGVINSSEVAVRCEQFAQAEALVAWNSLKDANWRLGTKTPHLLFNYLDYLLWKQDTRKPFVFEFRNSVEHWYPQHPDQSENGLLPWEANDGHGHLDRDRFGNLCLLTVKMNSRFSNLPPAAKAKYDKSDKSKDSLKYRAMIDIMEGLHTCADPNQEWKERECEVHEKAMLAFLQQALGVETCPSAG